ncbi:MAG: N-acetylmuramoyl-L-alanine amidase [Deltaproteobacteria bacterium]|nr:N-acetylmuramoyl-L-alanine amidase [Deltaproteobacteria bacterium]
MSKRHILGSAGWLCGRRPRTAIQSIGLRASCVCVLVAWSQVRAPTDARAAELVVLDPGHGGHLSGAQNADGVEEKTIVLAIALAARRALAADGYRVVLTRNDDRHVELADRIDLANRKGAAAFVSIHGNFSPVSSRRGVETYVLSAAASDETSLTLAHLENEGEVFDRIVDEDAFGGGAVDRDQADLRFILSDLVRMNAHQESGALALNVQDSVGRLDGFGPSRGLRQAPFRVLKGARMAAVLVEVGYLSNKRQGAFLATQNAQNAAGTAIARGVGRFLRAR